jgi:DNA adenine methylase
MKYVGSKAKHADEILECILPHRRKNQWFVEPFAGAFNVTVRVSGKRIASDINKYVVALFYAARRGWVPPKSVSESMYKSVTANPDDYPPYLAGFVGFGCSFGGRWKGGYARGVQNDGTPRDYVMESHKAVLKKVPLLHGVKLLCRDYRCLRIPDRSIIYCDPPYSGTTRYAQKYFDHDYFWEWVRRKARDGHRVYVSEYSAPDDFHCVWSKKTVSSLDRDTGSKENIERLYVHETM